VLPEPEAKTVALDSFRTSLRGRTISATHRAGAILPVNSDCHKALMLAAVK
jgi:hypothetical protein